MEVSESTVSSAAKPGGTHLVQFYEDEGFLCDVVADYLATGLRAGEPLVIIATAVHRQELKQKLRAREQSVEAALLTEQLVMLDAETMLSQILLADEIDERAFAAKIGSVLQRSQSSRPGKTIRVFGELVGLLWAAGNGNACFRLEELWNGLSAEYTFSLLCAYHSASEFMDDPRICALHTHVLPSQQYTVGGPSDWRLRHLLMLEQRSRALEAEVVRLLGAAGALRHSLENHEQKLLDIDRTLRAPLAAMRVEMEAAILLRDDERVEISYRLKRAVALLDRVETLVEQLARESR